MVLHVLLGHNDCLERCRVLQGFAEFVRVLGFSADCQPAWCFVLVSRGYRLLGFLSCSGCCTCPEACQVSLDGPDFGT